jgi:hypothetical protein
MTDLPRPPAHLEPYVRILGTEGAIAFLLRFGGAELYIPRTGGGSDVLAEAVGIEAARALAQAADRLPRRVPTGKPWIARVRAAQGLPIAEIARMLHVTDVTVRRWLADGPPDPRQMPLI